MLERGREEALVKLTSLIVLSSLFAASTAVADSRADAAASFIATALRGKTPKITKAITVVFDSGKTFAARSACAKLRNATIKTAAELTVFTGCLQSAATQLAVDKLPAVPGKDLRVVGVPYLKSWFAKGFHSQLVAPSGQRLVGTVFERRLLDTEASGVAVMTYVLVDGSDQITAVYAYAGHWAYPI